MSLAKADKPCRRCVRKHEGILRRHPILQKRRSGLGRDSCRVEQVFPRDRHTIQNRASMTCLRTFRCGVGFGGRTITGHARIDAFPHRMRVDGRQICLGQINRVDLPGTYGPTKFARAFPQPVLRHQPALSLFRRTVAAARRMDNGGVAAILQGMNVDTDILIAGGGLNGTTLALALASAGFAVTIVDPLPRPPRAAGDFDGRGYALSIASQRVLKALGVWDELAGNVQPILDIKVTDGRAGEGSSPFLLAFDHAEIEEGPMGYMVEDRLLRPALLAALDTAGIGQIDGARVVAQSPGAAGITVTLDNSRALRASLLVGCDGKTSGVATRAGIHRTGWGYGQTALVCAIIHEEPHHGTAHQFFMPPGPLAILPLTGNRASIVWTESTRRAAEIQAMEDADYLDVLRPRFGDFLGEISLEGARFTYPLALSLAQSFVADRVALVGDAAHAVHPIAGQGLNAGLKDVAALAEVLADAHRRGEDIGRVDVLTRYQQWRRFDATTLALATDAFNRLFSNDNSLLRLGRDIGMGLVNAMPGVRRGLIREAAGLTGDLPRLAKGQPL